MRGDFLGEAALRWEDLKDGRESKLNLVQREGIQSGPVNGTVTIFVGDPTIKLAQNAADASTYEQAESVEIEREVIILENRTLRGKSSLGSCVG